MLRIQTGSKLFLVDVPALVVVVALSVLLGTGTKFGMHFNTAVTLLNLAVIVFVFVAGVPHFTASNFSPFFPLGLRGAFSGASKVCIMSGSVWLALAAHRSDTAQTRLQLVFSVVLAQYPLDAQ